MEPPQDVKRYAEAYRRRERRREEEEEGRAAAVLGRLPELARVLSEEHGARVVGYFGSLRRGRLRDDSDVDLYVDRIRRGGYFRALDRASAILGAPVDLVELEKAPEGLRARIAADGAEIHG